MTEITGVHPYAEKFPMLTDAELDELAESIRTVGLLHPIVVDSAGLIVDGRNRLEACNRAEVEATVTEYDGDDVAEYVIACNVARRNMTTGARAMSTALVLAADGRRENGRWRRGSVAITESGNSDSRWRNALNQAGTVLDFTPDLASDVIAGDLALDSAYRKACDERDAVRRKLAEQERIAAEEADAKAFVEQNASDLAAQVGDIFQSYAEAQAVWEKRNREEAARIAADKRAKVEREKALRENSQNHVRAVAGSLIRLDGMQDPDWRERTRHDFASYADAAPPEQRKLHDPNYLRALAGWITTYANELEQQ